MAEPAKATTVGILLNWRQPQLTCDCLQDLAADWPEDFELLIIDNGSADGSCERLGEVVLCHARSGLPVHLMALPENLGFAGGMNRGIRWARDRGAAYVLVLNNDLRLPAGFLPPMVGVLRDATGVAAVAPTVLFPDGRVWAQGGSLGFYANALRLNGYGGAPAPVSHGPEAVDFVPGACVLFRSCDLEAVGDFDEDYFMYWEDADLCRRLATGGRRVVWLPWVRVTHLGGASAGGSRSPLRKYLMARNCVRYLKRHGRLSQWAALVLLDVVLWPLQLLRAPRSAWAKLCGLAAGVGGGAATARDVLRWHQGC